MNRMEQLNGKKFEEQEWQKLFNKHQQGYIRTRLEAIKQLQNGKNRQEVMNHLGCAFPELNYVDRSLLSRRVKRISHGDKNEKSTAIRRERKSRIKEDAFGAKTNRVFDRSTDMDRENHHRKKKEE
jgi:hypothetical protein